MLRSTSYALAWLVSTWPSVIAQTSSADESMPTATIANGTVVGTMTSLPAATAPVNKFLGIPYAKTPPERLSPPETADAFNDTLMAQQLPPACIQQFPYPIAVQNFTEAVFNYPPPPAGESEDCLYINVFAPSSPAPEGGRAVMFWIYGGAFEFGTGSLATYDGSAFAAYNDIVLVTHNYRTNIFGFPGSTDLPATDRNLGLLDQRLAMQWVQDNIEAFGGDPTRVTIFGESAGSFSVDAHITSFTTDDAPFRAAIMESGQVSYQAYNSLSTSNDYQLQQVASLLNCTDDPVTCVREAPALTLKAIIEENSITFGAVIDNYTYVSDRAEKRAAGDFAQVPTLIGSNANEGRIFEIGQTNLTSFVTGMFAVGGSDAVSQILQAFPTNMTVSDYDQISTIFTLVIFQCGSAYLADQNTELGVPTWRYLYNASFPNLSPLDGLLKAYHSAEIPLAFQTYPGGPINPVSPVNGTIQPLYLPATPQQYALGQYMNAAWSTFAKNPLLGPGWGKVGSFGGMDIGVLGGSNGMAAGVEMMRSSVIDAQCQVFKQFFANATGVDLPDL